MRRTVFGVGINDVGCREKDEATGKTQTCPYYKTWHAMMARCYSKKQQKGYDGCSVVNSWHTFSNFKKWMESQDWKGKDLDKDLITKGNRVYSPMTCVFIDRKINAFIATGSSGSGSLPTGVGKNKYNGRYFALCGNPITGKSERIGTFDTPRDAHIAWGKRKYEIACKLASGIDNPKVRQALIDRFCSYQNAY